MRSAARSRFSGVVQVVALLATAAVVQADVDHSVADRVRGLVADLNSDKYDVREEATDALMAIECPESLIHDWLAATELSLEQRNRLLMVAQVRLITIPRGALGIHMQGHRGEPGEPYEVEIIDFVEGMPAERVLRLGDRVTHVNSKMLTQQRDLRNAVQQYKPGEVVQLKVRRRLTTPEGLAQTDDLGRPVFEVINVPLELGSVETLTEHDGGNASNSEVLRQRRREADDLARKYQPMTRGVRFGER